MGQFKQGSKGVRVALGLLYLANTSDVGGTNKQLQKKLRLLQPRILHAGHNADDAARPLESTSDTLPKCKTARIMTKPEHFFKGVRLLGPEDANVRRCMYEALEEARRGLSH